MNFIMGQFRISTWLALIGILPSSFMASASPALPHELFNRASTCASASASQCPGVPDGFCCGPSTTCLVLASNTTLLCCPEDEDCGFIHPINCDINQQNVKEYPQAVLLTTNLTAALPKCGAGTCCPFGYSCTGTSCLLNSNQGISPSHTSSPSATSTPTVVPIINTSSIPTTTASAPSSTTTPTDNPATIAQPSCVAFPAGAVLAGFFPGMALGGLLAFAFFCLLGAYRRRQEARYSGSFGKISASISDPIYQEGSAIRTDFIRKQTSAPSTPSRQPTIQRVRSLFRRDTAAGPGAETEMAATTTSSPPPRLPTLPHTPRLQREPSGESINIFADPSTAREARSGNSGGRAGAGRDSHQTTFTDLMERADLAAVRKGAAFVPSHLGLAAATRSSSSPPARGWGRNS